MQKRVLTIITISTLLALMLTAIISLNRAQAEDAIQTQSDPVKVMLTEGKNYISLLQPMYVKEVMRKYPDIQAISYYDPETDKTIGYVRALGGVGKNFLLVPGRTYEFIVAKEITISVD